MTAFYNILWFWLWPEGTETLEEESLYIRDQAALDKYLTAKARSWFDDNSDIQTLKVAVIDFENNKSLIREFEKEPVGQYEILTKEY